MAYLTLAEFKSIHGISDTTDDTAITRALDAASAWIDLYCGRSFAQETAVRVFTAISPDLLVTPDMTFVTTVFIDQDGDGVTETEMINGTHYRTWPIGADIQRGLQILPHSSLCFPTHEGGVSVEADWGWPATPEPIKQACDILAHRWFQRKDSPYGIAGVNQFGQATMIRSEDPDVIALISPYKRLEFPL